MRWSTMLPSTASAVALVLASAACSPALDWRQFVPEGSGLQVTFPCRPDRSSRRVAVAGATVTMELLACTAGGSTFAVSFFDLADPAQVTPTLQAWRTVTVANVQGREPQQLPLSVPGATPNVAAGRMAVQGRRPDGRPVHEQVGFFVSGLRLYQATVLGAESASEAGDTFFGGLALVH